MNKKELELLLSKLKEFDAPKVKLEQYATDISIVADLLWNAYDDIDEKVVADLGCGTGFFGFGALILSAKKVFFVDIDEEVIKIAKENKKFLEKVLKRKLNCVFVNQDVIEFDKKVDVVLENPPFGVKEEHADKRFLEVAFEVGNVIYSFHKFSTKNFVEKFSSDNGFKVKKLFRYSFPIKKSYWFHEKDVKKIDVGCWKLVKE